VIGNQACFASLLNASPFAPASLTFAWAFALSPHAATKSQYLQSSSSLVLLKVTAGNHFAEVGQHCPD